MFSPCGVQMQVYCNTNFYFQKTLTYGILIGGWTVGVYLFQKMWENISQIVSSYQTYAFWYTLIVAFISFLVCYRIGPPRNERSKNLVMWTLQVITNALHINTNLLKKMFFFA